MGRVADLMILNILCIICCLPVVTAGASITAMFYVTLKMVRNEEAYIAKSFFKSFKQNFKQATIINIIMLLTGAFLYMDIRISGQLSGSMSKVFTIVFFMFAVFYLLIFIYVYPVLAKFDNTIRNTFTNALLMSIRHLPYTALMVLVTLCPVAIMFIPSAQVWSILLLVFILVGFSAMAYTNSIFFVKIFDHYIPKEEAADGDAFPQELPDTQEENEPPLLQQEKSGE